MGNGSPHLCLKSSRSSSEALDADSDSSLALFSVCSPLHSLSLLPPSFLHNWIVSTLRKQ